MTPALRRRLLYATLAVGAWVMVVGGCLAPAAGPGWRPAWWWSVIWAVVALAIHAGRTVRPHWRAALEARRYERESSQARVDGFAGMRQRLQRLRGAYEAQSLALETARLARDAARAGEVTPWRRLLALQGPDGAAWPGLAGALEAAGERAEALRCLAEAVRVGAAELDDLRRLAVRLLPHDGTRAEHLAAGDVAAVCVACFAPERLPARELGLLYEALAQQPWPVVLRVVLRRVLFSRLPDHEEASRQAERLRAVAPVDETLAGWVRETWAGYRMGGWREAGTGDELDAPCWAEGAPPEWRAALGLGAVDSGGGPLYKQPLPRYGTSPAESLEGVAIGLVTATKPRLQKLLGGRAPALGVAAGLQALLWPRQVRGSEVLREALSLLAELRFQPGRLAGLEVVAAALWEETDRQRDELREDCEQIARATDGDAEARRVAGVTGLAAAGLACAPVDHERALALWREALSLARSADNAALGPALARALSRLLASVLAEARRADASRRNTLLQLAVAVVDVAPAALRPARLTVLLLLFAGAPGPLRERLMKRLSRRAPGWSGAEELLRAYHAGDYATAVDTACRLWRQTKRPADLLPADTPPGAPARPARAASGTAWLGYLAAWFAGVPNQAELTRTLLAGASGRTEDAGARIACAWRLDRLCGRREPLLAATELAALEQRGRAGLHSALLGLRATLRDSTPGWLARVEDCLLMLVVELGARQRAVSDAERELCDELIELLDQARGKAHAEEWLRSYHDAVAVWQAAT
ncbi:MAG: hypothetical protein HYU66_24525 [Armatimonadetes bacterium]|nr:hypothetical protein [Armatimonadota bacterium]